LLYRQNQVQNYILLSHFFPLVYLALCGLKDLKSKLRTSPAPEILPPKAPCFKDFAYQMSIDLLLILDANVFYNSGRGPKKLILPFKTLNSTDNTSMLKVCRPEQIKLLRPEGEKIYELFVSFAYLYRAIAY